MTPLGDESIESLSTLPEFIDEEEIPEYVQDLPLFDSMTSPLQQWEKIIQDESIPNEERFVAFQNMYKSPYVDKRERCIRMLLYILEQEHIPKEIRFSWLTRLKISSEELQICLYGYVYWFYTYDDPILYKMLCAQFMLSHPLDDYPFMKTNMKFSQQWLYRISKTHPDVQIKSEAADMLIRLGTPNFRNVAKDVIQELGQSYVEKRKRTVYSDKQNIHEIEHVKEAMQALFRKATPLVVKMDVILHWLSEQRNDKALHSFQRIVQDTAVYEGYRMTEIMCALFQVIREHEQKVEIEKRLLEELEEMNGWCSTGHVVRLLNSIQGFDTDITITIPVREEIKASVFARFTFSLKTLSADVREEIMNEFTLDEKSLLLDFVESYSYEDELRNEYTSVPIEEFTRYYNDAVKEYIGN